jgi:SAM-dependent methyltransferase
MPWYRDWFDSDAYELVYQQRNLDDARRLADLVERVARLEPGAELLDVACGRGRHALLFASRGYRLTCFDLSPNALRTAASRAESSGLAMECVRGDMRALPFEEQFDGVLNLFTSFGYFEDEQDHQRVVDGMARALRPGGFVVQDFLNPAHVAASLVPEDVREEGDLTIRQARWIEDGRINKRITLGRGGEEHVFTESVRLLTLADFERLYAAAGLRLADTFGDYHGAPYEEGSPRLILYARR